jgi:hypothetical protein
MKYLFSQNEQCSCEEVGVPGKSDKAGLKKKNGVRASSLGTKLWGHRAG